MYIIFLFENFFNYKLFNLIKNFFIQNIFLIILYFLKNFKKKIYLKKIKLYLIIILYNNFNIKKINRD